MLELMQLIGETFFLPVASDWHVLYDSSDGNGVVFRDSDLGQFIYLHKAFK